MIGKIRFYKPSICMTLEVETGKQLSFKSNCIKEASERCTKHLQRLGLKQGVLRETVTKEILQTFD
ncbi:hypothetical protein ACR3AM_005528 [Bacillus thuringiensis]